MNIFVLDEEPRVAAEYHCDNHSVKMVLEMAQMLSTAHRFYNATDPRFYKQTHPNHPCSIWVRESKENYLWAYELFKALSWQYTIRYGKTHLSWKKLKGVLELPPSSIEKTSMTPFALAMPDEYKVDGDAVSSYRNYYLGEKAHLFKWTNVPTPDWINQ